MAGLYIYNIDFTVDDRDLWSSPQELRMPEDVPTVFRFEIESKVCIEISDEEYIEQVNCDKKQIKNKMFVLSCDEVQNEVKGKIKVVKAMGSGCETLLGFHDLPKLGCIFQKLMEDFKKASSPGKICDNSDACMNQPCMEAVKELVQLNNEDCIPTGTLLYTLRVTCFGPSISMGALSQYSSQSQPKRQMKSSSQSCLNNSASNCSDYDEYSAEVNGNKLIVRVLKSEKSYKVTRVFDSDIDQKGNEINRDKNVVTILGCNQQIDMKFPGNFACGDGKTCSCGNNSMLTEFQKKTSCAGKSFKNSPCLPVIRGNLKYPGRMDGMIDFKLYDQINPCDATEKYKTNSKSIPSKGVCMQVDHENIKREMEGKCPNPKGIEICKKGCSDPNVDVFVLKIGKKRIDKKGQKNTIELEMRTPKGPDNESKKMETREIQVEENEFESCKKPTQPKSAAKNDVKNLKTSGAGKTPVKKKK